MKHSFLTIRVVFIIGTIFTANTKLSAQEMVSSTNFARKTGDYENKEIILENIKVHQLYATRKPDGTIHNPAIKGKSRATGHKKGKSLPKPNCPYKRGYQEIRVDLGTTNYCFLMDEKLNKSYTEELAKFNAKRFKYGIRAEMKVKGNRRDGFVVSEYKWKQ